MTPTIKQERVQRSKGITPSEQYLTKLCNQTFLSLWSYPNIWRDQGGARAGKGKEICDLLVVFENHVIIFSDKSCEFPNSGNLELDWKRWFKRAVEKSAQQIWGAERWLKECPERVFLDQTCKTPFPINLPEPDSTIFHRIIVAHGASQRCQEVLGGSGSLMLDTMLTGVDHHSSNPFTLGQVNPAKGYVHVFDDTTLDIVLGTLDTAADFTAYLTKKETFLQNQTIFAAGEEELLALYLKDLDENDEHNFVLPTGYNAIALGEGYWEEFKIHPQRQAQIEANRISYFWDDLIERFNKHLLQGTRHFTTHPKIKDIEIAHRFMARENRTRRRMLSEAFLGIIANTCAGRFAHPFENRRHQTCSDQFASPSAFNHNRSIIARKGYGYAVSQTGSDYGDTQTTLHRLGERS
jgi:hypothetical protein